MKIIRYASLAHFYDLDANCSIQPEDWRVEGRDEKYEEFDFVVVGKRIEGINL
jgi:hypothetical protein